jgi:hypothetical protein
MSRGCVCDMMRCDADPTSRFSLELAVQHSFLTTDMGNAEGLLSSGVVDPLLLHSLPAVPLPLPSEDHVTGGASGADGDKEWARRQCSMVWAPMPADYSFSSDAAAGEEDGLRVGRKAGGRVYYHHQWSTHYLYIVQYCHYVVLTPLPCLSMHCWLMTG